jgi:hypothetical protein
MATPVSTRIIPRYKYTPPVFSPKTLPVSVAITNVRELVNGTAMDSEADDRVQK